MRKTHSGAIGSGPSDGKDQAKTLSEFVADVLREEIVDGKWRPNEKLKTDHLRERFSVSSATIRDALFVLMAELLVRLEGQKGFRVAPMHIEDAFDLAKTRAIVESAALEESLRIGDDKWEALITAEYFLLSKAEDQLKFDSAGALQAYEKANDRFHEALVSACASERLKTMRRTFFQEAKRYRRMVARKGNAMNHDKKEHEQLFKACLMRDIAKARALIVEHVHSSVKGLRADDFYTPVAEAADTKKAA